MKKGKRKAFGQHFLANPRIRNRIIRTISPDPDETIIEIGAGKGALTYALTSKAGNVIAIEKDPHLVQFLEQRSLPNLAIIEKDVMEVDFREIVKGKPIKIVGNLPYSISSPILFLILENKDLFSECHFLLQKEVAERLCAGPGSKKYAPLSILFENSFIKKLRFRVSPESFKPPPRVDSAFVSLIRRKRSLLNVEDEDQFKDFIKAAFKQRRKTLSNNMKAFHLPEDKIFMSLRDQGLDPKIRSEQISIHQFMDLYQSLFLSDQS
jgi:16S rRNA (adenine1518-N6/adenine1519-N6)-dimethyltransferase